MRFTALDSWRGICALLVAIFHFGLYGHFADLALVRGSYLFVDFFFVLSGFVITHAYAERLKNSQDLAQFLIRRFGRLWPLHMAMLGLYIAMSLAKVWLLHATEVTTKNVPFTGAEAPLAIVANVFLVHSMGLFDCLTWNAPSWSISAEFWAYIAFTAVVLSSSSSSSRRLVVPSVLIVVGAAAFLMRWSDSLMDTTFRFGLVRCLYGFFIGVLTHKLWQSHRARGLTHATIWESAVVLMVFAFVASSYDNRLGFAAPLIFAAAVFVFAFDRGAISRALARPTFQSVGTWSYSIYLVHGFIIIQASTLASIIEKLLAAKASPATRAAIHAVAATKLFQDFAAALLVLIIIAASSQTYRWIEVPSRKCFNNLAAKWGRRAAVSHEIVVSAP